MKPVKKTQYMVWELYLSTIISQTDKNILYVDSKTDQIVLHIPESQLPMFGKRLSHADCIAFQQLRVLPGIHSEARDALMKDILILDFTGIPEDTLYYLPNLRTEADGQVRQLRSRSKKGSAVRESVFSHGFDIVWESGRIHYSHFGSSASMTRSGQQVFVRKEREQELSERVTLGLLNNGRSAEDWKTTGINISKWSAYKGLSLSDGWDIYALADQAKITLPKLDENSVLIIPDLEIKKDTHFPEQLRPLNERNPSITFDYEEVGGSYRLKPKEVQKPDSIEKLNLTIKELNLTDGVGLIDPEFAETLNTLLGGGGKFSSFQLRMPFVKGMVHSVDFKTYLKEEYPGETLSLIDRDGKPHPLDGILMILPQSMFKCYKWFDDIQKGQGIHTYFQRFADYGHHLFVSQKNRASAAAEKTVHLNYQVLQTCGLDWKQIDSLVAQGLKTYRELAVSPEARWRFLCGEEEAEIADEDDVNIAPESMTDADETESEPLQTEFDMAAEAADRLAAVESETAEDEDEEEADAADDIPDEDDLLAWAISRQKGLAEVSPQCQARVKSRRKQILFKDLLHGRIEVPGTGRYLCCDLMQYLAHLALRCTKDHVENRFPEAAEPIPADGFYAPGYQSEKLCALFRNPHYAENEHLLLHSLNPENSRRERYLGHLSGVAMLPYDNMGAMRLGGADFDGDHVTITDEPLYVDALKEKLKWSDDKATEWVGSGLPVVMIPDLGISGENPNTMDLTATLLTEKERDAFFRSMKNQIGKISFQAFGAAIPDAAQKLPTALFTAYGGCEIDSVKKGYTMLLPGNARSKGPFLKIVKDKKLEKQKSRPALKTALNECFPETEWEKIAVPKGIPGACLLDYLPIFLYSESGGGQNFNPDRNAYPQFFDLPEIRELPESTKDLVEDLQALYQAYQHRKTALSPGYTELPFTTHPDKTLVRLLMPKAPSAHEVQEKLKYCTAFFRDLDDSKLQAIEDGLTKCAYELTDEQERLEKLKECLKVAFGANISDSIMDELQNFHNDGFALSYCLLRVARSELRKKLRQFSRRKFSHCQSLEELADTMLDESLYLCQQNFRLEADRETTVAVSLIHLMRSSRSISLEKMLWDADLTGKAAARLLKSAEGGKGE